MAYSLYQDPSIGVIKRSLPLSLRFKIKGSWISVIRFRCRMWVDLVADEIWNREIEAKLLCLKKLSSEEVG